MNEPSRPNVATDPRRTFVLVLSIALLAGSVAAWSYWRGGSGGFAAGAMGRIGLVLGALWLAWPSLHRPAQWLPPGMAVAGVVMLVVLAARPTVARLAIPVFLGLLSLSAVVRLFKR